MLREQRAEYGAEIIDALSGQLRAEFGRGFGRHPEEEAPIAIILCADKKHETVEYLDLGRSGIHVAQYLTELPSREVLRERFQLALAATRARLAAQEPRAADAA